MNRLTLNERLLIVAFILLVLVGSFVRYRRALRDRPETERTQIDDAPGARTDQF